MTNTDTQSKENRREFLRSGVALAGAAAVGTRVGFAKEEPETVPLLGKADHCIMLWLGGGACQLDMFDPKRVSKDGLKDPGSAYPSIPTSVPGIEVCEHLPQTAKIMEKVALVRTVRHDEIDEHAAAAYRMHVGRPTSGTIVYPSLGPVMTYFRPNEGAKVPSYVLMGQPSPGRSPGFLGPKHGFVYLKETKGGPSGLQRPARVSDEQHQRRMYLLEKIRSRYAKTRGDEALVEDYLEATEQGFELAGPNFMRAFDLENEPAELRNAYGDEFGQRCLLARRLVERGTRFIEVSFNINFVNGTGWDTHREGQQKQHLLIQSLDQAFATLVNDLERKKLLERTLVVISTEFGRPAKFDSAGGRGHQAKAFTCVLAGGGLKLGQAIGRTDELSSKIVERPVSVADWFATQYAAMGIPAREILYAGDRPVPIVDRGAPIQELFV